MKLKSVLIMVLLSLTGALALPACFTAEEPDYIVIDFFKGTPYERGFQHGERHAARIKTLYTKLLTNSIVPYLNREQVNIAPVLPVYQQPEFENGQFSYLMILRSGQYLIDKGYIADEYVCEMRGIADGAGMDFKEILILNTFFDTMMGFRSIVLFIQGIQEPYLTTFSYGDGLDSDGFDNNANGEIDEDGEGYIEEYKTETHSSMLEVPTDSELSFTITDPNLLGLACIDLNNGAPIGCDIIDSRCVDVANCIKPEYQCLDFVSREHFSEKGTECLFPRINYECLDVDCIQISDPGCVNPESVRIQMSSGDDINTQFVYGDDAITTTLIPPVEEEQTEEEETEETEEEVNPDEFDLPGCPLEDGTERDTTECNKYCDRLTEKGEECVLKCPEEPTCQGTLEVKFKPPGGFEPGRIYSITVQVGDQAPIYTPEPFHNRYMRDERVVFTTAGYFDKYGIGDKLYDIESVGPVDSRSQPTSLAFAARGSATTDGEPIMGHHFALLDNDMVHEQSAIFVEIPTEDESCGKECWLDIEINDSCEIPEGCEDSEWIDKDNLCKDSEDGDTDEEAVDGDVECVSDKFYAEKKKSSLKDSKKRLPHAILTYTGLVWGFSGMNSEGLSWGFTVSDSLDNPLLGTAVGEIFKLTEDCSGYENLWSLVESPDLVGLSAVLKDAELKAAGVPIGLLGRNILSEAKTADEALDMIYEMSEKQGQTYGWNMLIADANSDMIAVEVDGGSIVAKRNENTPPDAKCAIENSYIDPDLGVDRVFPYYPDPNDEGSVNAETGQMYGSVDVDDIRIASHFQKNFPDVGTNDSRAILNLMMNFTPKQQRYWTGFYLRSLRTFYRLGDEIKERYGQIDLESAIEILREPELVDSRDSMNAAIFQPSKKTINYALGGLPATSMPFVKFNLVEELKERGLDK